MNSNMDNDISKITVRLRDKTENIGSGVLVYQENFKDRVYIITASHCLFHDSDKFQNQREQISVDFFNPSSLEYQSLTIPIDPNLLNTQVTKDVAILVFDKKTIVEITGRLQNIFSIKERNSNTNFITKGFPKATLGNELAVLNPTWLQNIDNRFQLQLNEDYAAFYTKGFSGSGIFLKVGNQIYLYGIFTRFRAEEKGKVIYCQFIETINELLELNYLPTISFSYFGNYGLTKDFFRKHIDKSIAALGPRFSEKLNFKLPISRPFNDIARDSQFFNRLIKTIDKWIINDGYRQLSNNVHIEAIEVDHYNLRLRATQWLKDLDRSITTKIDLDWFLENLEALEKNVEAKKHELFDLQWREEKANKDEKKDHSYRPPYEKEISRLRELGNNNRDFLNDFHEKLTLELANNPYLFIKGDAGNGKSHLLGDIATIRTNKNLPTLLLLGQNFILTKNIWENIKSELSIECSDTQFLSELNHIGLQIGSRILILIDAINEGAGAELWNSRVSGFIKDFEEYPYLGLVFTIRTTYIDFVLPPDLLNDPKISIIDHEGFKGNEYAALKLFCEYHNLKQPHFPILAPEFTKPLFLKLICEAVKETPERTFPQGFQGMSDIFKIYIESLNHKLELKRQEYKNRKMAEKAIQFLAQECFKNNVRSLSLDKSIELFDNKFPSFIHLINDLIEENVFIRRVDYDYRTKQNKEVIYFSYERLGDFFMSEEILSKFKTPNDVKTSFKKNNKLGKLITDDYWTYNGLLESFAVLLPERFNLEIFEVLDWVFIEESLKEHYHRENTDRLNRFLFDSLNWRKIESIDNKKITEWFQGPYFRIEDDELFLKLVELSPVIGHPFNGDRLFRILKRYKMPKRDSFWQQHLLWFNQYNDYNIAYPIRRLLDWAWTPGISWELDVETTRLTGQTLTWILASTDNKLRDQTTKALVNLLEQQPEALISILKAFKNIDDLYILERLYAVTYGCILRMESNDGIFLIAKFVYNTIFKNGTPTKHILLRDYARNTVEYAIYKNPGLKFNLELIRPPYNSKMPDSFPTEEEVLKFNYPYGDPESKKDYKLLNNRIYHSVTGFGDFAKHIDGRLDDFAPISFTFEEEYKLFYSKLQRKQKSAINTIIECLKLKAKLEKNRYSYLNSQKEEAKKKLLVNIQDLTDRAVNDTKILLTNLQSTFFVDKVFPHLKAKFENNNWRMDKVTINSIKYWIIDRAFSLGYNNKLHGHYDDMVGNRNYNQEYKVDRIGKKYQVIAFMEIMSMVADNYKINKFSWSSKKKYEYYKGPWQLYMRDIDPAFVCRKFEAIDDDDDDEIDILDSLTENSWIDDKHYNNWNQPDSEWVENLADLPRMKEILNKTDNNGEEWLSLIKTANWREPKPIGEGKYEGRRKDIFYKIQAYFIRSTDKDKILAYLKTQNFWGNWMPTTSAPINLINREKFWSPAYLDIDKEKIWETIRDTGYKVIIATTDAVGEISDDKSGAHSYYDMPCKTLFDKMNLKYAHIDGEFKNSEDKVILRNIDYKGLLIKKTELLNFLQQNKLEIIWTVIGEKMSYANHRNNNYFKELSGTFHLLNDEIEGNLISFNRE